MAENVVTETVTPTTTASPVANENQAVSSCNPRTCPHYQENEDHNSSFECNICLDTAKDAVISFCGHLFCWSCLHQWLETRPNRQMCPVCKSAIGKDKVVPLYGRNGENKDPRDKVPPRPQGQRSEPTTTNFNGFNMAGIGDGGFQFSFGIGAFPFAMFASIFSFGDHRPAAPLPGSGQFEAEQTLNRLFIVVGLIFIMWLLLV